MQPPNDTQAFPAHEPGDPGHDPGTGPSSRAPAATRRRGPGLGAKIGIGVLAVLVLVGLGALAAEFGLRASLTDRLEQEASASLGSPATVDLGSGPVLPAAFSHRLSELRITAPGADSRPDGGFAPSVDLTAHGARTEGDRSRLDSLEGTVTVSDAQLSTAAREKSGQGNSPLAAFTTVQDVKSDPASGRLLANIGGIAQVAVRPVFADGKVELKPEEARVVGVRLPDGVLGGAVSLMDEAARSLPPGVSITGVEVVQGGLRLAVSGRDVVLE